MNTKKGTILVTGGAGFIGSHTVRLLVKEGYKVVVLDNLVYGHREAVIDPNAELIVGDIRDPETIADILSTHQPRAVIHFAAFAYVGESVKEPGKYYDNNLSGTVTLLNTIIKQKPLPFIFSSTCATYGIPEAIPIHEGLPQQPINPYGRSKLMIEQVLTDFETAFHMPHACLRYFNAAGSSSDGVIGEDHDPETHLIPLILFAAKGMIEQVTVFGTDYKTPDGTCIRDYIHVEDLGRAHLLAMENLLNGRPSIKCNLGTGRGHSVKEVIQTAEKVTGLTIPVEYGDRRPGDPAELVANSFLARVKLGWEPKFPDLETMIRHSWTWINGPHQGRFKNIQEIIAQ